MIVVIEHRSRYLTEPTLIIPRPFLELFTIILTPSPIMAVPHSVPFPSGGTWFDTLHKTFDHVQVEANNDNAIPTSDFLEAAESLTTLFGEPPPLGILSIRPER